MGYSSAKSQLNNDVDVADKKATEPTIEELKKEIKAFVVDSNKKLSDEVKHDFDVKSKTSEAKISELEDISREQKDSITSLEKRVIFLEELFDRLDKKTDSLNKWVEDIDEKLSKVSKEPSEYDRLHPEEEPEKPLFVREVWVAYKSDSKKPYFGKEKEDAEMVANGAEPNVDHVARKERWWSSSEDGFSFLSRLTEEENQKYNEAK